MPMDDVDRRALLSVRNLARVVVLLLVLLLLVQGVPTLLGFLAARRAARAVAPSPTDTASRGTTAPVAVERGSAGSVKTVLGYGIVLNKNSSLEREWVVINSQAVPAQIAGAAPVVTSYKSEGYSGQYRYGAEFAIDAKEPLTAIEVRFLTFDVWGDYQQTLTYTLVEDLPKGRKEVSGQWQLYSENAAEEYYASVAYIARVRTKSGRIIAADTAPVIEEAKKFSAKFNPSVLERATPLPSPSSR